MERERSKRLREESEERNWAEIASSRGESLDITCPEVVGNFCAPDANDKYPRVPCGCGKGSTESCVVAEILRDPWSDLKVLAVF